MVERGFEKKYQGDTLDDPARVVLEITHLLDGAYLTDPEVQIDELVTKYTAGDVNENVLGFIKNAVYVQEAIRSYMSAEHLWVKIQNSLSAEQYRGLEEAMENRREFIIFRFRYDASAFEKWKRSVSGSRDAALAERLTEIHRYTYDLISPNG